MKSTDLQKMDAPGPPAEAAASPEDKFRSVIADLLIRGHTPGQIAKALHPDDDRARRTKRQKIKRMLLNDPKLSDEIGVRGRAKLMLRLGPVLDGLLTKAEGGNPIAAKLVLEASGFHNPKMQHEHSGEVAISLNIPRPPVDKDRELETQGDVIEGSATELPPTG